MENKLRYINMYKGLAIVFLILGRLTFMNGFITNVMDHVWLCMLAVAEGASFAISKQRKIKTLVVPYISFSLVVISSYIFSGVIGNSEYQSEKLLEIIIDILTLYGHSMLWVPGALILALIIYRYARKSIKQRHVLLGGGVLMAAYLLCGNIFDFMGEYSNLFMAIALRIFATCWRSIFICMYIATGEILATYIEGKGRKIRQWSVPVGFILVILGVVIAFYNTGIDVQYLRLGQAYMFYMASFFMAIGLLILAEWIGVFHVLEFMGIHYLIVLLTVFDFKLMYVGSMIDTALVYFVRNRFVAHTTEILFIALFEIVLIWFFTKLVPVFMGNEKSDMFAVFKKKDDIE